MKPDLSWVLRSLFLALMLVYFQPATSHAAEKMMTIGTGELTGVYYSAGSAVAKMHNMKRKETGVWLVNQATEGSLANIDGVLENDVDFGISQANFLYQAWHGDILWDEVPQKDLRAVMGLYTEDITLIAATDAGINTPMDIKGKRVNIGAPGSSDQQTSGPVLDILGLDLEKDVQVSEDPTYIASEKIQSNDIDAYFYTVGHPNLSIIEAASGERKVRIVPFDEAFITSVEALRPYLEESEIDVQYYENLENKEPVSTIGLKAILFTRASTDDEVVYRMVKQVVENLELFRRQHPAFVLMSTERMSHRTIVPLHPGAERYFKEAGIIQ